jgi:hypothetical protein
VADIVSVVELIAEPGRWLVPLTGCSVTQCCVDYGFTLIISDGKNSFDVRIEQAFELALDGEALGLDPEGDPRMLAPALAVLHAPVAEAVAFDDGRLVVKFTAGGELRVPGGNDYEPWTLVGPAGLRLVSMPGGELAIWKPGEPSPPAAKSTRD